MYDKAPQRLNNFDFLVWAKPRSEEWRCVGWVCKQSGYSKEKIEKWKNDHLFTPEVIAGEQIREVDEYEQGNVNWMKKV